MPVCPFCQTDLPMPNLPCRNCGKRMADHPSLAEGKSYSVKPAVRTSGPMEAVRVRAPTPMASQAAPASGSQSGEVPELELATRHAPKRKAEAPGDFGKAPSLPPAALPKKPAPARAKGNAAPGGAVSIPGVGGAVFEEDDIFAPAGGGGPLELDTSGPPSMPKPKEAQRPTPPLPGGSPSGSHRSPSSGGQAPLASSSGASGALTASAGGGMALEKPELTADQAEAASLADYGESPSSWWQTPLYAYRVKTRQAELRRQLKERQEDLARARQAEEGAKIAFADRARPVARKVEALVRVLEPIQNAENLMVQRDGMLSAEVEAHKGRLAVIDERIAGLSAELVEAKAEERQIEEKLAEAEAIRQRADAKLKRAEIEIRNASSLADAAGAAHRDAAKRAGLP
jgi:nucleotide-binding universal stress UspA family protein